MTKALIVLLSNLICFHALCQSSFLILKKGNRTVQTFYTGQPFTFQTDDKRWITGRITNLKKDSFYFTQEIIHYGLLGSDTVHFGGMRFSIADIKILPTRKEQVVFRGDETLVVLGNESWIWVRNGWLLQVTGAGYVGLRILNDLRNGNHSFEGKNLIHLGIGTLAFITGTIMHHHFDPFIHLGKKYKFECIIIP